MDPQTPDWASPSWKPLVPVRPDTTSTPAPDDWATPDWHPPVEAAPPKGRTLLEHLTEAPQAWTDWAHQNAEDLNNTATTPGLGSTLKGFAAGAHEAAVGLLSPVNVVGALADVPGLGRVVPAALRGLSAAVQSAHGVQTAEAAPDWGTRARGVAEATMGALGLHGAWSGLTKSVAGSVVGGGGRAVPSGEATGLDTGYPAPTPRVQTPASYDWADPHTPPVSSAPMTHAEQVAGIDPMRLLPRGGGPAQVGSRIPTRGVSSVEGPAEPLDLGAPRSSEDIIRSMGLGPRTRGRSLPANANASIAANAPPAAAEPLTLTEFPNTTGDQQALPQELPEAAAPAPASPAPTSTRETGPRVADLLPPAERVAPLPEVASPAEDAAGSLRAHLADLGLVPRESPVTVGQGTAASLDAPVAPWPGERRVLPRTPGAAVVPAAIRDRVNALYDTLAPKLAASKQALSDRLGVGVESNFPPGGYDESRDAFTRRVLEGDPQKLFGAERKIRADLTPTSTPTPTPAALDEPVTAATAPVEPAAPTAPRPLYDASGKPMLKLGKPRGRAGGRAPLLPTGPAGELGATSLQALSTLTGGLIGGGYGAASAEPGDKLKGGLEGAAAGALGGAALTSPKLATTLKALRMFGLFGSPVTTAKKFLGDASNTLGEAAVRTLSGEGGGGRLLRETFSPQLFRDIQSHYASPEAPDSTFASAAPALGRAESLVRAPTKALGAVTEGFQDAHRRAGLTSDEAERLTAVADPRTQLGQGALAFQQKGGALAQLAMPVARVPINMAEMGVEGLPGAGYAKLAMDAARGEHPPTSTDWWRATAKQILGGSALGYGAYRGLTDKDVNAPASVPEKLARAGLGGLMTVPESVGEGLGAALNKHAKPGTTAWGRAATGAKNAFLKNLPLPTGIDFDPRQWLSQFAPTGLTTAGQMVGGPAPRDLKQPDMLDPLIARLPGLNLLLHRKKPAKS